MKEIYLDNAATTRPADSVLALMQEVFLRDYGNPSAMHLKGVEAEQYVREAAGRIAATLRCREKEILFTSGGTESNNLALFGGADARKRQGKHIISTDLEHPSVAKVLDRLKEMGYAITRLPADKTGSVTLDALKEAMREDTILVSVMHVNNELGSVQPVEEIGAWLKANAPDVLFHVDAVQSYGKYRLFPQKAGIDLLSVSGHKLHGPKGVGFLYIRDGVRLVPQILGGGQQKNLRSGTLNVPGIAGLGLAGKEAFDRLDANVKKERTLLELLRKRLLEMEDVKVLTPPAGVCAPHVMNASFPGVRSEVLLHALEDQGIYVSAGSACASHHSSDQSILSKMGYPKEIAESTLRFSLSAYNTEEEIETLAGAMGSLLPMLRKFRRR